MCIISIEMYSKKRNIPQSLNCLTAKLLSSGSQRIFPLWLSPSKSSSSESSRQHLLTVISPRIIPSTGPGPTTPKRWCRWCWSASVVYNSSRELLLPDFWQSVMASKPPKPRSSPRHSLPKDSPWRSPCRCRWSENTPCKCRWSESAPCRCRWSESRVV